jgi:hypothetical protein
MTGSVLKPKKGFKACFAEMEFEIDGLTYDLSTQVKVIGAE